MKVYGVEAFEARTGDTSLLIVDEIARAYSWLGHLDSLWWWDPTGAEGVEASPRGCYREEEPIFFS
jgi:hypothetical protein